jgi:hypothetical protein
MLYAFLILACLEGNPTDCREYTVAVDESLAIPPQCDMASRDLLPKFKESHPKRAIMKWRCRPATGAVDI